MPKHYRGIMAANQNITMTVEMKAAIAEAAHEDRVTPSEFIRVLIDSELAKRTA